MHCTRKIAPWLTWVGASDMRLERFENMFPLTHGVSYNAFLITDEKTALVDSVDAAVGRQHIENVSHALGGRKLDYLIIQHMEPDHCANIDVIARLHPEVVLVGNAKTFNLLDQFYPNNDIGAQRRLVVKENDELALGAHTLRFVFAPMVHWPEVMLSYELTSGTLFSADAFGTFGALGGNIFADEMDFAHDGMDEARRYYTNIVGRFGPQVQMALKKLHGLPLHVVCPLHGPIWREGFDALLHKYDLWSRYEPEEKSVTIAYASMYGNTENAAQVLATMLAEQGVRSIRLHDVSKSHASHIIADTFRNSHLVLAAPTYNMGLYYGMENLLQEMGRMNIQKRKVALIGNGSWATAAIKEMSALLAKMKGMEMVAQPLEIRSALSEAQLPEMQAMAQAIVATL